MKSLRIALATDAAHPDLSPDDRILAEALRSFADVYPVVWSEADCPLHPDAFLAWVRIAPNRRGASPALSKPSLRRDYFSQSSK